MTFSPDVQDIVDRIFRSASLQSGGTLDSTLQVKTFDLDFHLVSIAESKGGAGGSLHDLAEIAVAIGRYAARVPIVENAMAQSVHAKLVGSVLRKSTGVLCVGWTESLDQTATSDGWVINGELRAIPWVQECDHLLLIVGTPDEPCAGMVIDRSQLTLLEPRIQGRGIPAAGVQLNRTAVRAEDVIRTDLGFSELRRNFVHRAATLNAAMLVGAAERACALTLEHVRNRQQFGSPLIRFQSVAHSLAGAIAERDLMTMAVQRALNAGGIGPIAAAAAAVASRSAGHIAATCHQLHGAIGITQEYPLHGVTALLWFERERYMSQREAEYQVGCSIADATDNAAWEMIIGSLPDDLA